MSVSIFVKKLPTIKKLGDRVKRTESTSLAKEVGTWIASFLGLIALMSAAFALLGFGVAVAVGGTFGASVLRVADSPFHCLKLSSIAFIQIFSKANLDESIFPPNMGYELAFVLLAMLGIALFLVMVFLTYSVRRNFFINEAKTNLTKVYSYGANIPVLGKLISAAFLRSNWRGICALPFGLVFGAIGLLTSMALKHALMFPLFLVAIIPILGYNAGKQYFYAATIEPDECIQLVNAKAARRDHERALWAQPALPKATAQKWGATCLVVKKLDNQEITRGRLVIEVPDAVLLYFPQTGESEFIPIKDTRVVKVGSLK